jgi:peroxiredoxin
MTAIPTINWKGIKPAEAFQAITAASGIKIFYTPRPTDKPGLPERLNNASVAFLLEQVAYPARLRISYQADGVHMVPGDPDLNSAHSAARWPLGLPQASNPALEASPEFQVERQRRLELENAALLEKNKMAALVKVGDPAPDFTCRTTAGEEFTLSQMKDKVVIIHFFTNNQWAWDTVQKFEKEILPRYGNRKDLQVLAIFSQLEAPKLAEIVKQKNISHPTAAEPQSDISAKFSSRRGTTYVIGKDGKIKQCLNSSLVFGKANLELEFTAESIQALDQTLQRELAVNP